MEQAFAKETAIRRSGMNSGPHSGPHWGARSARRYVPDSGREVRNAAIRFARQAGRMARRRHAGRMIHLLNILAAIALLVWGTHIVRVSMLEAFGEAVRQVLAKSLRRRAPALLAGMGVASLLQSGTATCMLVASFVAGGLVPTAAALAVVLGADVGSALMAVLFSFDLSWMSPLFILVGVVLVLSAEQGQPGRIGRIGRMAIGLGLVMLALDLIVSATAPMTRSDALRDLLLALPNDVLLDIVIGAVLTVMVHSSLAVVLLVAALSASGGIPVTESLGLVLGANLGSGLLALLSSARAAPEVRRLPLANLLCKALGCAALLPFLGVALQALQRFVPDAPGQVVAFHLGFNTMLALACVGFVGPLGRLMERLLPAVAADKQARQRPPRLDPDALSVPSLAITCAAREALHQADLVETMLRGVLTVIRNDDLALAGQLRTMHDRVDELHTAIKFYLTRMSCGQLSESENRRWTDVLSFTINMEQSADLIERILLDVEEKQIRRQRSFSQAGMAEIADLHQRLIANLQLAMSVFLERRVRDAERLLREKAAFRDLEHRYTASHIARLQDQTAKSIETSSLHLDLLKDLKRINSHICAVAYPILDSAGALSDTRIRHLRLASVEASGQHHPG
jgi:phosphate:Na+ symporter